MNATEHLKTSKSIETSSEHHPNNSDHNHTYNKNVQKTISNHLLITTPSRKHQNANLSTHLLPHLRRRGHHSLLRRRLRRRLSFPRVRFLLRRGQRPSHQRLQHPRLPPRISSHRRCFHDCWMELSCLRYMLFFDIQRQIYQCHRYGSCCRGIQYCAGGVG